MQEAGLGQKGRSMNPSYDRPGEAFSFPYEGVLVKVVLTREFVKRFRERKPSREATTWLLTEGVKEPVSTLLSMPGTKSLKSVLKATTTQVSVVAYVERRRGKIDAVNVVAGTVYRGPFSARDLDDYVFEFKKNPPVDIVFENSYEPSLVWAVLDDLGGRRNLKPGTGHHLGNDFVDYVVEVDKRRILVALARWEDDVYVYDFPEV